MEHIIYHIVDMLDESVGSYLIVFLISMMPILELRGGILAASLLKIDWRVALIICIIGNILPIPFVLLFINKIFSYLKNTRFFTFVDKFEKKLMKKSESVLKYEKLGLFLFVAIPLPGTGAWTGAAIAALLKMPIKESLVSIILGVLSAGIIMSILSYGVLGFFM